jgi:hypothetical protein
MQAEVPAGPNFRLWASSIGIQRNISPIFRGRAGLAGYYSTKHAEQLRFSDEEVPGIGQKAWGFAPFLGGEWMLGHIGLVVQGGPYLIRPATMKKFSYTQYGFQFYPFDIQRRPHRQMYLRVFVHAHDFEADFAEIGLGYQW